MSQQVAVEKLVVDAWEQRSYQHPVAGDYVVENGTSTFGRQSSAG
ncbi:hypothetical protein ACVXHB_25775 [Escherichia coli]